MGETNQSQKSRRMGTLKTGKKATKIERKGKQQEKRRQQRLKNYQVRLN
jgi:hypothetical protein